jgi:chlorite dismutase
VRRERQAQFKQRSKEYWKVCGRRREAISKNWMLFDEMRREMLGEHISQAEEKLTTLRHAATQSSSQAMLRATQSPPPRVRPTTAL